MKDSELKKIAEQWHPDAIMLKRPMLADTKVMVTELLAYIRHLEKEVAYEKKRQDLKEQNYKAMHIEIGNVINKYV